MKTDQEKIAIMQAHLDGKKVECKANYAGSWHVNKTYGWNWEGCDYRIAPEPKLRPWKPEEVPVGALIRYRSKPHKFAVILGVNTNTEGTGVGILSPSNVIMSEFVTDWFTYHGGAFMDRVEHSIDHGKTWHPCGIKE